MNSALPPEVAARAQARRELAANLGALRKVLLTLAGMLPPNSGARPVEEVLARLKESDGPRLDSLVENLKQEIAGATDVNNVEAEKWKEQGIKSFELGKLDESLLMYTRGVMYAGQNETLASLLYNRSTVFLTQKCLLEALADAHVAFSLVPNNWRALELRGMCLQKLGLNEESKKDIDAAGTGNAESANTDTVIHSIIHVNDNRCKHGAMKLQEGGEGSSTSTPLNNMTYNSNTKRVEAKCDLESGEVLTETPVVHALYDDHWGIRCSYCFRVTQALYSGTPYREKGKLARGLFCSDACARQSWDRYGQYETENPFFQICPVEALVASRMLWSDDAVSKCLTLRGDFTGELYPAAVIGGYETAVSLCALLLDAVQVKDADRLRFAQRQVLLSGFEVKFHTFSYIAVNPETREALIDEPRIIPVGKALYVSAAQFRHSCDPNCFASFVGNPLGCSLQFTIRVIKAVRAGEELTIAYNNMTTYKGVSALFRRRALAERYGFICNCKACIENKDERVTEEKKKYYIEAGDLYQKGCRLIREGQYDVAVTVLSQSYTIAMEHLCPPPRPPQSMIPKTHMALARAFNHLKNNEKCVENLLAKLELDRQIYGEYHSEFVGEYILLAYFSPTKEKREEFAKRAKDNLVRFYAPSKELFAQISRLDSFVTRAES